MPGPLRKELAPALAIVALTLAVEMGVFFLACGSGLGLRQSASAALMTAVVWTALAAPIFAAGACGALRSLIRAGLVADATLLGLLAVWVWWNRHLGQTGELAEMTFTSILEVYCTFAAMTVLSAGAVNCSRRPAGRYIVAAFVGACMMLALASPLWTGGLIAATDGTARAFVAGMAVWLNPFYSITTPLIDSLNYVIHQEGVMYQLTLLGDYVAAPACPWFTATSIYLPLGIILLLVGRARPPITQIHAE
jgi:hypothetical protein